MLLSPTIFHLLFLSPFFYLRFLLSFFPLTVSMLSFLNTLQTTNVILPRIMLPASDILNKNGISKKRKKKICMERKSSNSLGPVHQRMLLPSGGEQDPWGQWQRLPVQTPWSSNNCHFRARLSHTWMLNEFTIRNYIRKKFCHVLFSEAEVEWKF